MSSCAAASSDDVVAGLYFDKTNKKWALRRYHWTGKRLKWYYHTKEDAEAMADTSNCLNLTRLWLIEDKKAAATEIARLWLIEDKKAAATEIDLLGVGLEPGAWKTMSVANMLDELRRENNELKRENMELKKQNRNLKQLE